MRRHGYTASSDPDSQSRPRIKGLGVASPAGCSVGEDDDQDDGTATLTHTVRTRDPAWQGVGGSITLTELDNDRRITATGDSRPGEAFGTLQVTWEPVVGARAYSVEWSLDEDFEGAGYRGIDHPATSMTLTNLNEDTVYFVRVTAHMLPHYGYTTFPSVTFSVRTPGAQQHRPFMRGWRLALPIVIRAGACEEGNQDANCRATVTPIRSPALGDAAPESEMDDTTIEGGRYGQD